MSEETVLEIPVETVEPVEAPTPIVEETPVVEAPDLPEQIYQYQPMDENGRALGGKQVIKYRTQDELVQKMTEQNINLVRALREQTRKNRLGIGESESIPTDAPKFDSVLNLTPRELTLDERAQLSRDLLDPEKAQEATNMLLEASIGASPEKFREAFSSVVQDVNTLRAKVESDAFMQANPDYYACMDNYMSIADWMVKNNLKPVRQNFQLAYDTLKKDGIILGKPEPEVPNEEVVPVQTAPEVVPAEEVPAVVPQVRKKSPPPSGLRDSGSHVPIVKQEKYTLSQINKMSGEEYKKKILFEKGFPETVERLEREAAAQKNKRN